MGFSRVGWAWSPPRGLLKRGGGGGSSAPPPGPAAAGPSPPPPPPGAARSARAARGAPPPGADGPRRRAGRGARAAGPQAVVYRWLGEGPWQPLGGGLPQPLDNMVYALARNPHSLFAGLINGDLFGSEDGGDSWRRLEVSGDRPQRITALVAVEDPA